MADVGEAEQAHLVSAECKPKSQCIWSLREAAGELVQRVAGGRFFAQPSAAWIGPLLRHASWRNRRSGCRTAIVPSGCQPFDKPFVQVSANFLLCSINSTMPCLLLVFSPFLNHSSSSLFSCSCFPPPHHTAGISDSHVFSSSHRLSFTML